MELLFPSFPVFCLYLLFFLILLRLSRTKSKPETSTSPLPPGPWKLPIIGNMHQLLGSKPVHHLLRDMAKQYGSLMYLQLGEVPHMVVSSAEVAKHIMKTHDITFADRPFLISAEIILYNTSDIAFQRYGDYWRQLKKLCMLELLSAKRVQSFRSIREEETASIVRKISAGAGSVVNLSQLIFSSTYSITARATFGDKCEDQDAFIPVMHEIMQVGAGFSVVEFFPTLFKMKWLYKMNRTISKLESLHREQDKIVEKIIASHKAKKAAQAAKGGDHEGGVDALLDVLLNFQERGDAEFELKSKNVKAIIMDMFVAGSDTSSTIVEWAISEMLKDPRVMKKAQAEVRQVFDKKGCFNEEGLSELTYLKLVIKEALRLHPPISMLLPRECRETCEINGYQIPAKAKVIVNAYAIGRDPKYWDEADRFYPERFLNSAVDYKGTHYEYIPFGAGRRMCPGITYGLADAEIQLASLLYHFDWKLPGGMKPEDVDMIEAFSITIRRQNDLNLIPIPYCSAPSVAC